MTPVVCREGLCQTKTIELYSHSTQEEQEALSLSLALIPFISDYIDYGNTSTILSGPHFR